MKTAKITAIIMLLTALSVFSAGNGVAYAHYHGGRGGGSLLQGVIIGAGAAILGAAIVADIHDDHRYPPPAYYRDGYRDQRDGHWAVQRVWIEPQYGERWNPGHYNRHGFWVKGGYDRVVIREGYWENRRIWVVD